MIKRVYFDAKEGDIIEINRISEPLYIYHNGEISPINPLEYNICVETPPEERWVKIMEARIQNRNVIC